MDESLLYTLGAAAVTGDQVAELGVQSDGSHGYGVAAQLTPSGASAFGNLTSMLANHDSPTNQFAIYAQGRVQTSPYVEAPITAGTVYITGFTSEADAQRFITDVSR